MPITWLLDNDRPSRRAMIGAGVAVAGVLILLNSKMLLATLGLG